MTVSPVERLALKAWLARFTGLKVLVVGDLILDEYVWGAVSRISPEAPVPVVEVTKQSYSPGGASYVASLVQYLGGQAFMAGVVGQDADAKRLRAILKKEGVRQEGVVGDPTRPTTHKVRVMAQHQQIVRIDYERNRRIDGQVLKRITGRLKERIRRVDAVVLSDYAKGMMAPALVHRLIGWARRRRIPVLVDPKPASGVTYRGATIVTPNTAEAGLMAGFSIRDERDVVKAGRVLLKQSGCRNVLITRGEAGMSLFESGGRVTHIPTRAKEVFDVSGAGDAVVSSLALALAAGASVRQAAELANFAAGVEVGKLGTAKITREEIAAALDQSE